MNTTTKTRLSPTRAGFSIKCMTAAIALLTGSTAFAAATGGFSTTDGGSASGSQAFTATSLDQLKTIVANAKSSHHLHRQRRFTDQPNDQGPHRRFLRQLP
jgi:pectate lyase